MNEFSIKIVGPAGFGIKSTGIILAKFFTRQGFNVFGYTEYPSLIRGGHNTYQINISDKQVQSSSEKCDILIPLTLEALKKEIANIKQGGLVICDEALKQRIKKIKNQKNLEIISAPLVKIAKESGGELMKNTVALGILIKILGLDLKILGNVLKDVFAEKLNMAGQNIQASKGGYEYLEKNNFKGKFSEIFRKLRPSRLPQNKLYLTGNQATAMGCIAGGCQLYAAYPMTPATDILQVLEANQRKTGMLVHQPEDEIAAIHVALGASFAGARAACGTSGGGFALMNEGLSLAGQLELPLVIFEVQRPAPATSNPTWTEQGDLSFVVNAGHGEFPRIVLAPGNPEQCFVLTQRAFNLADKYQVPVIVLSDKFLGESGYSVSKNIFNKIGKKSANYLLSVKNKNSQELFKRYKITKTGISPRTIPGIEGGEYIANSDEHNELSYSDESGRTRQMMMDKRMRKLEEIRKEMPLPKLFGPKSAEVTLICWGSMLGPCLDAMDYANKSKVQKMPSVNVLHFAYLWPLPKGLDKFLSQGFGAKKLVLIENNKTGQLGKLIKQETGIDIKNKLLKYNSRPFWNDELAEKIKNL